jgi:hypothetical protein
MSHSEAFHEMETLEQTGQEQSKRWEQLCLRASENPKTRLTWLSESRPGHSSPLRGDHTTPRW